MLAVSVSIAPAPEILTEESGWDPPTTEKDGAKIGSFFGVESHMAHDEVAVTPLIITAIRGTVQTLHHTTQFQKAGDALTDLKKCRVGCN